MSHTCNQREIYQSPACIYKAERRLSIAGMYIQSRDLHVPIACVRETVELLADHIRRLGLDQAAGDKRIHLVATKSSFSREES